MWPTTLLNLSSRGEKGEQTHSIPYCILNVLCFRSRPAFHPAGPENIEPSVDLATTPSSTSSYLVYRRIFQMQTSPFIAINTIVVAGIHHEVADSGDEATNVVARLVVCPPTSE